MTEVAALIGVLAILIWASWVRDAVRRWWRRSWRAFKHRVARAPIDFPVWLWRKVIMFTVPGWLSAGDFYQTVEWRTIAAKNKRDYGSRCVVCSVSNAELPSGTALHSHHVKKRLTHPWLALSSKNLAPVCPTDHRLVESGTIKLRWDGKRWGVA